MRLHPIHTLIIHFPVALLPMDLLFMIASRLFNHDPLFTAAYYCLIAGTLFGWMAVLTGLFDLFTKLPKHGPRALNRGWIHGGIQSAVIVGSTILASIEYNNASYITAPPDGLWVAKIILVLALFTGNYLGGDLLLTYVSRDFQD